MPRDRRPPAAFSLIEVLLVIALMAILAAVVLPNSNPSIHDQLQSAAQIVAADLSYARSLAVTYGSNYRVEFNANDNRYVLQHSGANAALDALPDSPFRNPYDPADRHVVQLDQLPHLGPPVRLAATATFAGALASADDVEFGPLGETTRSEYTLIWLAAGEGASKRYVMLYVNPVTGLTTIGPYSGHGPPESMQEPAAAQEIAAAIPTP
jgi:prepilin-type N-terminal cleavage/methylation domain-containing protein